MVVGHSSGEIGAAYVAGALSVREAVSLAYHRGRLAAQVKVRFPQLDGCRMAVGMGADEVRMLIKQLHLEEHIAVACENSPGSTTASGDATAMDQLANELAARQMFHRKLHVHVAYHSPHMKLIAQDYARAIQQVAPGTKKENVQFYSSLLGQKVEEPGTLGASYWVDNLTHPVRFSTALEQLCAESKPEFIIEIGPIKQILQGIQSTQTQSLASLVRHEHATKAALQLARRLFLAGHALNLGEVNQTHAGEWSLARVSRRRQPPTAALPAPRSAGADEVEIKVACTGANFKDMVIAMGQVASPYLGIECSGTVARVGAKVDSLQPGDRVCAMCHGAYSTYARCPATSAAVIPEGMDFDMAASVPVTYSTAYYGLVELAKMEAGESILIHAAAGGVGQAAIQLAQLIGADIYATVGNPEKKQMLIDRYRIPARRIFYSRNLEFGLCIREATGGRGVDVVLNSLAGEFLRETWDCLAPFGRFIEIGKRDITSNTRLEMGNFENNCTFSALDLSLVAERRGQVLHPVFTTIMQMFAQGRLHPVYPVTTVGIVEVESVLRKLQSGKTTGKVVVDHRIPGKVKATHPLPASDLLSSEATYIIVGGTGGIGQSLTRRLVQRRARHVVLLSRRGTVTEAIQKLINESLTVKATIYVKQSDVSEALQVKALLAELQKGLPPVRGVIYAAMVLKVEINPPFYYLMNASNREQDILFEQMTFTDWDAVLHPKVAGAWNLHRALQHQPLDFFVMLSSVAGIIGNRGQAAYAAGNCFLDALAQHRRQQGLPAVSLDLAAVNDIGVLSSDAEKRAHVMKNLASSGHAMHEVEVLALVEMAMQGRLTTVDAEQCITGVHWAPPSPTPYYASSDARFTQLVEAAKQLEDTDAAHACSSSSAKPLSLTQQVRRAATLREAIDIAATGLRDKLGEILMLPREVLETHTPSTPIVAFGLDSLNAIELRNWLGRELKAHMQVLELLSAGVLGDLALLVLKKSTLEGAWKEEISN
ncbi:putative PKS/NRPS-like protein biosynthetic cluster [Aspergillus brasiliensis]|nr:putative PKS/NRPS-like protein biosynthetic cluster [Aspergillus brasiliensis]